MEIKLSPELAAFGPPSYATPGSAAVDLRAFWGCPEESACTVWPDERATFLTGLTLDMRSHQAPPGMRMGALIIPRSGLGVRGVNLANTLGLIDEDYNNEIKLIVRNTGDTPITIAWGDRVAQLMFVLVPVVTFEVVTEFTRGGSGRGGFGSTGAA